MERACRAALQWPAHVTLSIDILAGQLKDPELWRTILAVLERTLEDRRREQPEGSYTAELLADPPRIGAKVREEADEVARAAAGEADERVAEEAADVLYHLAVLLRSRDVPISQVLEILNERRKSRNNIDHPGSGGD